jgi:hypothetical protein
VRPCAQADQRSTGLSPCASRPCGGRRAARPHRLPHVPSGPFCCAQMGAALCPAGAPGLARPPALRSTAQRHVRTGAAPQSLGRARASPARLDCFPGAWSHARHCARPTDRRPTGPCKWPLCLKKHTLSYCRPTGRLEPTPAELA